MDIKPHPVLSIALPAYEEGPNLSRLLPALHEVAKDLTPSYEIVVIDTENPRDDTPGVCERCQALYVARRGGGMYGDAIRTALEEVRGEYVVLMDADGSHNPTMLRALWNERAVADLVIASRYVKGGKTENPVILIFMSLTVNFLFRLVLGLRCRDVSNSYRLYLGNDLRSLDLRCRHFDIVEEILVKLIALHPGYRVKEVPCIFEKRKAGQTKRNLITFAFGYAVTLIRLARLKRDALRQAQTKS